MLGSTILTRRAAAGGRPVLTLARGAQAWLGALAWAGWVVFLAVKLRDNYLRSSINPPRTSALADYVEFITTFWRQDPLYLPDNLRGFHYLPVMLVLSTPLTWIRDWATATVLMTTIFAALFTYAICRLAQALYPGRAVAAAGLLLALSAMAAADSLTLLNATIPMTALMILGAAAAIEGRWRAAALWIGAAVAVKPLAIVMALLTAAIEPRTRAVLALMVVAELVLPFVVQDWGYLAGEYVNYVRQLGLITAATPGAWANQVDFSTLLYHLGIDVPPALRTAIRVAAALGTLALAWRVAAARDARATGLALLVLACCYIALFNPRNENVSLIVVVAPALVIALCRLERDLADLLGWGLLALALLMSTRWSTGTEAFIKPPLVILVWAGVLWLMVPVARWRALLREGEPRRVPLGDAAMAPSHD